MSTALRDDKVALPVEAVEASVARGGDHVSRGKLEERHRIIIQSWLEQLHRPRQGKHGGKAVKSWPGR